MFERVSPGLYDDILAVEEELTTEGFTDVLLIWPAQVSVNEVDGKLGFYVLIANNQADRLTRLLKEATFPTCDILLGRDADMEVVVVLLRNLDRKAAIAYPLYCHESEKVKLLTGEKKDIYTFFRVLSGEIVASVRVESPRKITELLKQTL